MQGVRTHLPKFKFSTNFQIGLHDLKIKKNQKMPNISCEKIS